MDRTAPPATHVRDEGRARARRLTWWAAVAATALTGAGAGIAAVTVPGHTVDVRAQSAPSSPDNGSGGSASGGGTDPTAGTNFPPAQAPQPGQGGGPLFISGGS